MGGHARGKWVKGCGCPKLSKDELRKGPLRKIVIAKEELKNEFSSRN